ncbi:sporulation protein [Clostridium acetobutylicum]|nr:sporulation protein [Clostridium acetobutylicum]
MEKRIVFNIDDSNILYSFSNYLSSEIKSIAINRDIVFLCIGTDRSTGDSLGPMVGYKLTKFHKNNLIVFGTLQEPVHAKNLCNTMDIIKTKYENPFIIAIDACLGSTKTVGNIVIQNTPLSPGSAMNKSLPTVGDLSITGIVNVSGPFDFMVLQSTRLYSVLKLADIISRGIHLSIIKLSSEYDSTYNKFYTRLK